MPRSNKSPRVALRRNVSTQTVEAETFLEIARLEEQVKLLSIENRVLRDHTQQIGSTPHKNKPNNNLKENHDKDKKKSLKGCTCKGNCSSKICGCVKRDGKCTHLCKCSSKLCQNKADQNRSPEATKTSERLYSENEEHLNPITNTSESYEVDSSFEPKHEIARTPPRPSNAPISSPNEVTRISDILLPPPIPEVVEEEPPTPPELLQVHVDWNKHQAQLVPCDKCNRKFYPVRIHKHKKVCKGV